VLLNDGPLAVSDLWSDQLAVGEGHRVADGTTPPSLGKVFEAFFVSSLFPFQHFVIVLTGRYRHSQGLRDINQCRQAHGTRKELVRKVYFLFSLGREVHTLTLGVATAVFIRGGYDPVWLRRGRVTRLLLLVAGLFLLLQMRPLRKQYPRAISLPRRVLRSKD